MKSFSYARHQWLLMSSINDHLWIIWNPFIRYPGRVTILFHLHSCPFQLSDPSPLTFTREGTLNGVLCSHTRMVQSDGNIPAPSLAGPSPRTTGRHLGFTIVWPGLSHPGFRKVRNLLFFLPFNYKSLFEQPLWQPMFKQAFVIENRACNWRQGCLPQKEEMLSMLCAGPWGHFQSV